MVVRGLLASCFFPASGGHSSLEDGVVSGEHGGLGRGGRYHRTRLFCSDTAEAAVDRLDVRGIPDGLDRLAPVARGDILSRGDSGWYCYAPGGSRPASADYGPVGKYLLDSAYQ